MPFSQGAALAKVLEEERQRAAQREPPQSTGGGSGGRQAVVGQFEALEGVGHNNIFDGEERLAANLGLIARFARHCCSWVRTEE